MRLSPTLIAVIAVSGILGAAPGAHAELRSEEPAAAAGSSASVAAGSEETRVGAPTAELRPEVVGDSTTLAVPTPGPSVNPAVPVPGAENLQFSQATQPEALTIDVFAQSPANPTNTVPSSPEDPATPEPTTQPPSIPIDGTSPDPTPTESAPADTGTPPGTAPGVEPAPGTPGAAPEGAAAEEPRVLVAEVEVAAPPGQELSEDLASIVYDAIDTSPGRTTTRTQLQQDINSVFATGFFSNVRAVPEDTPLGVRVTFLVQPNPVLQTVRVSGNTVLPQEVVDEIFEPQYGQIINLIEFQDGILALNEWYQNNGYVLAQVVAAPAVSPDGVVTLEVAEGVVEDIRVRFLNAEGDVEDEEGNPIRGRTRDFIITREFSTQPGAVFNQQQIEQDLQRVFGLGIFDDVRLSLEPGQDDPREVDVVVNVTERNTGSVAAGVGFNFTGDLFGTVSYRQDNFGGNNQKFSAEAQLSSRDLLFDVSFTDPWIAGDPYRTSYTVDAFARRAINLNFDGGPIEVNLPNGDEVRVRRIGTGVSFSRPLGNGWTASLGTQYQNVSTRNFSGGLESFDARGNPLTQSAVEGGGGVDDLWTVNFSTSLDQRNDAFNPTSGSLLRLSTEQSIPLGGGSIFMNRVRAGYSYYIPVSFINFSEGPQALAFNVQAGTVLGELPPYEAFSLGGTNSVRGYDEGAIGSGRNYLQATVEYRFPLFSFVGGAAFIDAGTDLGSGFSIPGAPGPTRGKPGSGLGYGLGLRVQTPLGPLRIDYGLSINGGGRLHFGIGERF
ncbi:MAG TPA: BamA/TamA family outer membrane protein [Trichocoleus sp.]